jgi:hypothetical protein
LPPALSGPTGAFDVCDTGRLRCGWDFLWVAFRATASLAADVLVPWVSAGPAELWLLEAAAW